MRNPVLRVMCICQLKQAHLALYGRTNKQKTYNNTLSFSQSGAMVVVLCLSLVKRKCKVNSPE